jgi:hypothetical protein
MLTKSLKILKYINKIKLSSLKNVYAFSHQIFKSKTLVKNNNTTPNCGFLFTGHYWINEKKISKCGGGLISWKYYALL